MKKIFLTLLSTVWVLSGNASTPGSSISEERSGSLSISSSSPNFSIPSGSSTSSISSESPGSSISSRPSTIPSTSSCPSISSSSKKATSLAKDKRKIKMLDGKQNGVKKNSSISSSSKKATSLAKDKRKTKMLDGKQNGVEKNSSISSSSKKATSLAKDKRKTKMLDGKQNGVEKFSSMTTNMDEKITLEPTYPTYPSGVEAFMRFVYLDEKYQAGEKSKEILEQLKVQAQILADEVFCPWFIVILNVGKEVLQTKLEDSQSQSQKQDNEIFATLRKRLEESQPQWEFARKLAQFWLKKISSYYINESWVEFFRGKFSELVDIFEEIKSQEINDGNKEPRQQKEDQVDAMLREIGFKPEKTYANPEFENGH